VLAVVNLLSETIGVLVIGLLAAAIVFAAVGRGRELGFGACVRVSLAAYSVLVVLELVLDTVGLAPGPCAGVFIWTILLGPLVAWRVAEA
jgi:hypothetical protein